MVKYLVLLAVSIALTEQAQAQWVQQSSSVSNGIRAVAFADKDHGWCIGASLTLRTTNAGMTWTEAQQPTSNTNLNDIYMLDTLTGWIVGDKGTILRRGWKPGTVGIQWHTMPSGVTHNLNALDFRDAQHGWVCGTNGIILATTDGGSTWTQKHIEAEGWQAFNSIYFADSLRGWAVGWVNVATTDGGNTWERVDLPTTEEMRDVLFLNSTTGLIIGRLGTILRTTNAGASWQSVWSTTGVMLTAVDFATPDIGWIVGGGVHDGSTWLDSARILLTTDAGQSWAQEQVPQDKWIMDVDVVDMQHVWSVGNGGTIYYRDVKTGVLDSVNESQELPEAFVDYDLLGRVAGYGSGFRLRRYSNSGLTRPIHVP